MLISITENNIHFVIGVQDLVWNIFSCSESAPTSLFTLEQLESYPSTSLSIVMSAGLKDCNIGVSITSLPLTVSVGPKTKHPTVADSHLTKNQDQINLHLREIRSGCCAPRGRRV